MLEKHYKCPERKSKNGWLGTRFLVYFTIAIPKLFSGLYVKSRTGDPEQEAANLADKGEHNDQKIYVGIPVKDGIEKM